MAKKGTAPAAAGAAQAAAGNGNGEAAAASEIEEDDGTETEIEETDEQQAMPKGYRRRSAVTDAPWFTNKVGNVAHGKLLGRYIMTGVEPPRAYYQVELVAPCTVTVGRGDDAEEEEAAAGDVVNVGENFKLKCLKEVEVPELLAGAEYNVWIDIQKKIKLKGGKTMWVIDVASRRLKGPTGDVRPLPPDATTSTGGEAESEAPF